MIFATYFAALNSSIIAAQFFFFCVYKITLSCKKIKIKKGRLSYFKLNEKQNRNKKNRMPKNDKNFNLKK